MLRMTRRLAPVLALVLSVGVAACGGDDPVGSPQDPQTQVTSQPGGGSPTPTVGAVPTLGGATPSAVPGLPADYPNDEVPVIRGVVTGQSGGTSSEGRQGWVLELSATGDRESCFAQAAAALVAEGFTKQGELVAGDTIQAQYTSADYAVIISARSDGDELCQVGYEVGEVSK